MQANSAALSLISPVGYQSGDCGYCKDEQSSQRTPNSRANYYAICKSLRPEHYQELVDRGWRRSGTLVYLPDASRSCCPHYTIRLPASEFQTDRAQRQVLYRWNRYILGEKYIKQAALAKPKTKEQKKQAKNTFDLNATVHEAEQSEINPDVEPAPEHNFTVTLEPDTFTEEKYALFSNYQQHVHHESPAEISKNGFQRFLCSSPLQRRTEASGKKLGSYHHCYRIDGRLIAMSVLDLLPHCVSGVYFVYHQDFEKWSFGKLSALREAALANEAGHEYYYMGYYIHGCQKMRYKATYKPQYVLDFDTFGWDVLDDGMRELMEKRHWVSMSRERKTQREIESGEDGAIANNADDIYPPPPYPKPTEAADGDHSLLEIGMPGCLTLEQLREQVDLDSLRVNLGRGRVHHVTDLVIWEDGSDDDPSSIKGIVAEMAACLGPKLACADGMVLDFSK